MSIWWATSKIWSKSSLTQAAGIGHRAPCTAQSVPVGTLGTSSQLESRFVLAAGSCLLVCFRNWVVSGVTASPPSAEPGGGWWSAAGVERLYLLSHEQLRNMEFFHLSYADGEFKRILYLPIKPVFESLITSALATNGSFAETTHIWFQILWSVMSPVNFVEVLSSHEPSKAGLKDGTILNIILFINQWTISEVWNFQNSKGKKKRV